MTKGFLTIEKLREREAASFRHDGIHPTILDPLAGECARLFTSGHFDDCLTHLTRYLTDHPERWSAGKPAMRWEPRTSGMAWCGVSMSTVRQISIGDASGFACWKCIEKAEARGVETFNLVPDTGCSVSGGKRGHKRGKTYPADHYAKHSTPNHH